LGNLWNHLNLRIKGVIILAEVYSEGKEIMI
jgi:hypothetical protein